MSQTYGIYLLSLVPQVVEIGILLALMCKHACESCDFILFMNKSQQLIEDSKAGILEETSSLVKLATAYKTDDEDNQAAEIPKKMLQQYLVDRKHVSTKSQT